MENKWFLSFNDVALFMDVSVAKAYKIIRQLHDKLGAAGKIYGGAHV